VDEKGGYTSHPHVPVVSALEILRKSRGGKLNITKLSAQ